LVPFRFAIDGHEPDAVGSIVGSVPPPPPVPDPLLDVPPLEPLE
jgi:hypothetical protein